MYKLIESKNIYSGRVVNLSLDKISIDGTEVSREVIRHRGGVAVLAEKDGAFLFVTQYRHPMGGEMLEIPAGTRNANEPPELTAKRELEEECGLIAKELKPLGRAAVSPGYTDEVIYIYYANEFSCGTVNLDEDEFLTSKWIKKSDAFAMLDRGEIFDAKTMLALLRYKSEQN